VVLWGMGLAARGLNRREIHGRGRACLRRTVLVLRAGRPRG